MNALDLLLIKYPPGEYLLLEEVSDHVNRRDRSLDYMAIGMWSSRGHAIIGIEQKSNRSDWLKELKTPQKQEGHFKYCNGFYLLTTNESVAKLEEIPATWGWMNIEKYKNGNGYRLRTIKESPYRQPEAPPIAFICAMLRRAGNKEGWIRYDSIKEHIELEYDRGLKAGKEGFEYQLNEFRKLHDKVKQFENETGLSFLSWQYDAAELGQAVKFQLGGGLAKIEKDLKEMKDKLRKSISSIDEALKQKQ